MPQEQGRPAPVADWVTIPELHRDPFPIYERLRSEGGVHWVPAVGRYLITSYQAVHDTELDQQVFSANEAGSLQIRAMGHSMLRRDDPEHHIERRAWQPALRPGTVKKVWTEAFYRNAKRYLDQFLAEGPGADLVWDFAAPYAAENLRELLGLHNSSQEDLQRWSQTMIDATGNYADDPGVWALGKRSFDEVDIALDEMLDWHARHLDDNHTLIAQLLRAPGDLMPLEKIRANMKMSIGGGLNEPRDALGVAAWALLANPEQRAAAVTDPTLWSTVFDETIRWVAPIGMYSRQVTEDTSLTGVHLPAGSRLGICILSANRDEHIWSEPDRFDIHREIKPHLAFGKGTHVCLGAWVARAEIATVALPMLFQRLEGLSLIEDRPAEVAGWVFRGMTKLPVTWTGVREPSASASASGAGASEAAARIAIVGSGPSGCFSAQALRRALPNSEIDVFEEQPVPFGLVRYGVAADHQGTKSVSRQFERLFDDPRTRLFANTRLGSDVSLDELRTQYDAVVLATGMHADAELDVPGAAFDQVHGAGRLTRLLNSHPDEETVPELGASTAIIGHGNVALDIARLLAKNDFEGSDLHDDVRDRIANGVRVLHMVGRSSPEHAKFDPVMLREIAQLEGVEHVVHGADLLATPEGKDARIDAVRALSGRLRRQSDAPRITIEWWFGAAPVAILGEDRVTGLRIASGDGEFDLPASSVVTAIGFTADPDSPVAPSAHVSGRVERGLYVAGWLRRGPRGTIPDQRSDAKQLARMVVDDLQATAGDARPGGLALDLPEAVDFAGWQRVDLLERLTAAPGRVRAKLRGRAEQLAAARNPEIDIPVSAQHRDGGGHLPLPVTVAFATESGGAELAAEDLSRSLAAIGDSERSAKLLDLSASDPESAGAVLYPSRLHLIICSTYGDGELPTEVREWHDRLRSELPDLSALRYAILGMGDSSYTKTYSRGAELLDETLHACGARRVGEFGRHDASGDVDASTAALEWSEGVLAEATEVLDPVIYP